MNARPLLFVILFFSLSANSIFAQPLKDMVVNPELEIIEGGNHNNVIAKLVFPDMTSQEFKKLSEIYVEFSLTASITSGTIWPAYLLEVHCLGLDLSSTIGNIVQNPQGEPAATHFWKSSKPQDHLRYDEIEDEYYVDLTIGFCDPGQIITLEMIGYVDIILFASDPILGIAQSSSVHCAQLNMEITLATFTAKNGQSRDAAQMGTTSIEHGDYCTRVNGENMEINTRGHGKHKNSEVKVYPNPVVDNLYIQVPASPKTNLYIYHSNGQLIYTKMSADQLTSFSIKDLEAGLYFLRIQTEEGSEMHKFIAAPSQ